MDYVLCVIKEKKTFLQKRETKKSFFLEIYISIFKGSVCILKIKRSVSRSFNLDYGALMKISPFKEVYAIPSIHSPMVVLHLLKNF